MLHVARWTAYRLPQGKQHLEAYDYSPQSRLYLCVTIAVMENVRIG